MASVKYRTFRKLLELLVGTDHGMRLRLYISGSLILLSSSLNLILPWGLKYIVDVFSQDSLPRVFILAFVSYGVIWTLSQVSTELKQYFSYKPFARSIRDFSLKVFKKLLYLPLPFHQQTSTGGIRNAMERAENAIPNTLFGLLFFMLPLSIELLITAIVLGFIYGFTYSAVLCSVFIAYSLFTYFTLDWVTKTQIKNNEKSKQVGSYVTDILLNIEGVCYQSGQKAVYEECSNKLKEREKSLSDQLEKMSLVGVGQAIIAGLGLIAMTTIVGMGVLQDNLVAGDFVLFNGYILQMLVPLHMIGFIFRAVREGMAKMEDVIDILDLKEEPKDSAGQDDLITHTSDIEFRSVVFRYPGKTRKFIDDMNFIIPSGESVAIVGENGSGKSTITKLLYRFYDLQEGKILIHGKDIRKIKLSSLRNFIGIVPQDVFLLNDTIRANLTFGLEREIPQSLFDEVIKTTRLDTLIESLPEKYETNVGERGVKLSGGERQCIGLARTLLREPKVIVLDEATSALDSHAEHKIYNYLNNLPDVTKLIITHDWRNITDMDKVIYLDQGNVSAIGSHKELITISSKYLDHWSSQGKFTSVSAP